MSLPLMPYDVTASICGFLDVGDLDSVHRTSKECQYNVELVSSQELGFDSFDELKATYECRKCLSSSFVNEDICKQCYDNMCEKCFTVRHNKDANDRVVRIPGCDHGDLNCCFKRVCIDECNYVCSLCYNESPFAESFLVCTRKMEHVCQECHYLLPVYEQANWVQLDEDGNEFDPIDAWSDERVYYS